MRYLVVAVGGLLLIGVGCVEGRPTKPVPPHAATSVEQGETEPATLLAALTLQPAVGLGAPTVSDALHAAVEITRETQPEDPACPEGMLLVSGEYCPEVEQRCVRWLETEGRYAYYRCAEYARPAKCLTSRETKRFCIDRDEYVPPNEKLPANQQSWTDAHKTCTALGKRVCFESEWVFACEGEEMRPYPYGFTRDANACNADQMDIYRTNGELKDLRDDANGHPRCVSAFGVHHLSGNLEEWTTIDSSVPARPAMKGAYWQPSRNHCRAAQTAHDRFYHGAETGFRCCKDAE